MGTYYSVLVIGEDHESQLKQFSHYDETLKVETDITDEIKKDFAEKTWHSCKNIKEFAKTYFPKAVYDSETKTWSDKINKYAFFDSFSLDNISGDREFLLIKERYLKDFDIEPDPKGFWTAAQIKKGVYQELVEYKQVDWKRMEKMWLKEATSSWNSLQRDLRELLPNIEKRIAAKTLEPNPKTIKVGSKTVPVTLLDELMSFNKITQDITKQEWLKAFGTPTVPMVVKDGILFELGGYRDLRETTINDLLEWADHFNNLIHSVKANETLAHYTCRS